MSKLSHTVIPRFMLKYIISMQEGVEFNIRVEESVNQIYPRRKKYFDQKRERKKYNFIFQ